MKLNRHRARDVRSSRVSDEALDRPPVKISSSRHHDPAVSASRAAEGAPLGSDLRRVLEPSFGHSFGDVRIHDDAESDAQARQLDAAAFTVGGDIHFRSGFFDPRSPGGMHLLAHEAAHVVQNDRFGRSPDVDTVSRPGDLAETEADAAASAVMAGESASVHTASESAVSCTLMDLVGGVGKTIWDVATDDTIGGLVDVGAFKDVAPSLSGVMDPVGKVLGPLGVISGGMDLHESLTSDESNFENTEQGVLGVGNILSGLASTAGLFGVGSGVGASTAMSAAGLAEAGLATGAVGGTLGAGLAAGGQVIGAGLAGYGAGRLLDNGVDWLGDAITGNEEADHSISGTLADGMVGMDQLAVQGLRGLGVLDNNAPAYTQTLGWQLAEILPSWMQ
jgi:hypothetical protein